MRLSQLFTKTTKNIPADETAKNAQLLIQAGYIHKEMAGVYAYLPLGLRVLENIKQIIREEMNALGGQELIMSSLQRQELWEVTDRWDDEKVDIWFKSELKNGTPVGFGWSHEEPITDMMKNYISSYRDLPVSVYQFQTKLRNELRAKSGIMRGREFVMKDLYSYARTDEEHQKIYDAMTEAYLKIFERVGLGDVTFVVKASGGAFTKYSHEFQTLTDAGEDILVKAGDGSWFNLEIAPAKVGKTNAQEEPAEYEERELKGVTGVQALIKAFDIPIEKSTKTLIYRTDNGKFVFAAVRSDYDISAVKLTNVIGCKTLSMATKEEVRQLTGAEIGYAGIVDVPEGAHLYVDDSIKGLCNFETGANKTNYHAINVNFGRDVPKPDAFHDFKEAREGDLDPDTDKPLELAKAAEVGNIFSFGTAKSEELGLYLTDETGSKQAVVLGSYGIGVTRLMGVVAEHFADDRGLVWPVEIAPARVILVRLGDNPEVVKQADELYNRLTDKSVAVLYDERDMRPGEKFADADLMGIPYRVVISEKTQAAGAYELKVRRSGEVKQVSEAELLKTLDA